MQEATGGGGPRGDLEVDDSIETLVAELDQAGADVRTLHTTAQNIAEKTSAGWGGRAAMESVAVQNSTALELRKLADALDGMAELVRENCEVMEETEQVNQASMQGYQARAQQMGFSV